MSELELLKKRAARFGLIVVTHLWVMVQQITGCKTRGVNWFAAPRTSSVSTFF